jgi:hypothetical protein
MRAAIYPGQFIADTSIIPPAQRLDLLLSLRNQINGAPDEGALARMAVDVAGQQSQSDEKVLLESLGPALAVLAQLSEPDREAVRDIVITLTKGMEARLPAIELFGLRYHHFSRPTTFPPILLGTSVS